MEHRNSSYPFCFGGLPPVVFVLALVATTSVGASASSDVEPVHHVLCGHEENRSLDPYYLVEVVDAASLHRLEAMAEEARLVESAYGERVRDLVLTHEDVVRLPGARGPVCRGIFERIQMNDGVAGTVLVDPAGNLVFRAAGALLRLSDKIAILEGVGVELDDAAFDPAHEFTVGQSIPDVALISVLTGEERNLASMGAAVIVYFPGRCAPCAAQKYAHSVESVRSRARSSGFEVVVVFAAPLDRASAEVFVTAADDVCSVRSPVTQLLTATPQRQSASRPVVITTEGSTVASCRDLPDFEGDGEQNMAGAQ